MARCPWMNSITVTATAQRLSTLLRAIDAKVPLHAQSVAFQADLTASTTVYVGNENVDATHCGFSMVAGQAPVILAGDSNLLDLSNIWLVAASSTDQINIVVVTR